jgi:hypothetical protein
VLALGEFGAVGSDEQGRWAKWGGGAPRASKMSRCLKVLVR